MSLFLSFVFLFFIGSMIGWILELFYRRFAHGKWVNPGFLIGPYLPIYGFGLCALTYLYLFLAGFNLNSALIILLMGFTMTLIELIGGLTFIYGGGVKLWDYSDRWGNYKGIICPLFSIVWTVAGAIYYYFIAGHILKALKWFSNNLSFSFILGVFFGVIVIDFIYSTKVLVKIRKFAKENQIEVKYEEFKSHIQERQKLAEEKYSFLLPFKQTKSLKSYLDEYKEKILRR